MNSLSNQEHISSIEQELQTSCQSPHSCKSSKSKLCKFFKRGTCPLSSKECLFAHGVKDLIYHAINLEEFLSKSNETSEKKDEKVKEENEDDEEPSLKSTDKAFGKSHINLYEYQHELLSKGLISSISPLSRIDKDHNYQKFVKNLFRKQIQQEFVDLLFEQNKTNHLPTFYIKANFQNIDFLFRNYYVQDNLFSTEVKIGKKGNYTVRLPQKDKFEEMINQTLIQVIVENNLIDSLPIAPVILNRGYFKHLAKISNPLVINMSVYLKGQNLKLEQYLSTLNENQQFLENLAVACNKSIDVLMRNPIFEDGSRNVERFNTKLVEEFKSHIDHSELGLVKHKETEEKIISSCTEYITLLNKNITTVKRLVKTVALKHNTFVFNLLSESYFLSFQKLKELDYKLKLKQELSQTRTCAVKPIKIVHSKIFERIINPVIIPENERWDPKCLDSVIDSEKVILVNDEHTLEIATEALQNTSDIAIDLEGALCVGGITELIQCECNGIIFVFDIFEVRKKSCLSQTTKSKESLLYLKMLALIKSVLENPKICKVFHDGRKDSLALHLFNFSCPQNTFDVGAIYMFIEQLKKYLKFKDSLLLQELREEKESKSKSMKTTEEDLTFEKKYMAEENFERNKKSTSSEIDEQLVVKLGLEIERVGPPGLNDVLKQYEASHGLHILKDLMHTRFGVVKRDYFLQRPIDREFLLYAAKDVEDLVEVKYKMIETLEKLFEEIFGNVDKEMVLLLCSTISRTYTDHGCCHNE